MLINRSQYQRQANLYSSIAVGEQKIHSFWFLGINRLLGNGTYEAAFPPHEVRAEDLI